MAGFIPNERDKEALQWMFNQLQTMSVNAPIARLDRGPKRVHQSYGSYIALPPADGIPALTRPGSGTGSTLEAGSGDMPGYAQCDIYRLYESTDGTPTLTSMGVSKRVYNLTESTIEQGWITVVQTKAGQWIAQVGGGTVSCASIKSIGSGPASGVYSFLAVDPNGNCKWVSATECFDEATTGTGSV